jgi:hypothetical protein
MIKLSSDYKVFFVHSNDDHDSLSMVIEEVSKKTEGFGTLFAFDRHNVALCSESFADAFDECNEKQYGGAFWLTQYELHPKRLPLPDAEKTLKVDVPFDLTSLQVKTQLRKLIDRIGKFIPVSSDKVNIRVPLKDGSHRGFSFLQFDAADEAIALVKMFLPTFSFTDTKKDDIRVHWYRKRVVEDNKKQ